MKSKSFRGIAAVLAVALAALLAWPAFTAAQLRIGGGAFYYFFQVVNENDEPFITPGAVRCSIYGRGSGDNAYIAYTTAALLHNNTTVSFDGKNINGSYTLPLASNDNGIIHWYSATSAPVNVKCFSQYGDYAYKQGLAITTHKVKIETSSAYKISRFPYVTSAGAAVTETSIVIPAGGLITDMAVEVTSSGIGTPTDGHINVGFAGNHVVATRNALVRNFKITNNVGFHVMHSNAQVLQPAIGVAPQTHLGLALVHTSVIAGTSLVMARPYMVHVNSGLTVTYDTSLAPTKMGGHVYIFWRMLHVGFNSQPLN